MNVGGGMSKSNGYLVKFNFYDGSVVPGALRSIGIDYTNQSNDIIELFCDEAQLPNISAGSGSQIGRYLGQTAVKYPTSKIFTDFQLGWMCDANMTPHKFLNVWFESMFEEVNSMRTQTFDSPSYTSGKKFDDVINVSGFNRPKDRGVVLRYPKQYQCDILIAKAEPGPDSATERVSEIFVMEQSWPISIDSVPLSYGASQVAKVTAQFSYTRHYVIYNDIRSLNSTQGKNSKRKRKESENATRNTQQN